MEIDPDLQSKIMSKITVLHPPQWPNIKRWEDKNISLNGRVRFTFVGHLFFMKGGGEILNVFDRLLNDGCPISLDIVSHLATDSWASASGAEQVRLARDIIARHPEHIRHWNALPNADVIDLFRRSHVGLLPSYADTYGYSILESQSCGCPVVSTDIGAMPEINSADVGWLIQLPKRDYGDGRSLGRSLYHTEDGRRAISNEIQSGLLRIVLQILDHSAVIKDRGLAALRRVRREHDPVSHSERLRQIYTRALM